MSGHGAAEARAAAQTIRARVGDVAPVAAIILGSGLGGLAEEIDDARTIHYRDVPGFPSSTVAGHAGQLIAGTLRGVPVLALAGRFHLYEGHDAALAGYPVRVVARARRAERSSSPTPPVESTRAGIPAT